MTYVLMALFGHSYYAKEIDLKKKKKKVMKLL